MTEWTIVLSWKDSVPLKRAPKVRILLIPLVGLGWDRRSDSAPSAPYNVASRSCSSIGRALDGEMCGSRPTGYMYAVIAQC